MKTLCPSCNNQNVTNQWDYETKSCRCNTCGEVFYEVDNTSIKTFQRRVRQAIEDNANSGRRILSTSIQWADYNYAPEKLAAQITDLQYEVSALKNKLAEQEVVQQDPLHELRKRVESFNL